MKHNYASKLIEAHEFVAELSCHVNQRNQRQTVAVNQRELP